MIIGFKSCTPVAALLDLPSVQYNTATNYNLRDSWTNTTWQCQQKLIAIVVLITDFVAGLLHWITLYT